MVVIVVSCPLFPASFLPEKGSFNENAANFSSLHLLLCIVVIALPNAHLLFSGPGLFDNSLMKQLH